MVKTIEMVSTGSSKRFLGLSSFSHLKNLFSTLFKNKYVYSFQCETCQFFKHNCASYPVRQYKSSKPFSMIHSDIWGPSHVNNISKAS